MKTILICCSLALSGALLSACYPEARKADARKAEASKDDSAGNFEQRSVNVAELKNDTDAANRRVSAAFLADRIREAVLAVTPHPHLASRAEGADYFISGRLSRAASVINPGSPPAEGAYQLSLQLRDANATLAEQQIEGATSDELDAKLALAVKQLLADAREPRPQPLAPVAGQVPAAAAPKPVEMPGEEVLDAQPKLAPLAPFAAPVPKLITLPNGLRIYLVERQGDGIEAINLVLRRGGAASPDKPGLASLTASMMEAGAAGMSQTKLAEAADRIGGSLRVSASQFATVVGISAMPTRLPAMVALLGKVALQPTFAEAEWKRIRAQREAEIVDARAQPGVGADHAFRSAVYGSHPLGRPLEGTAESVKALSLADVKAFYAGYSPQEAALVAVGGAAGKDVIAALTKAFGGWKAGRAPAPQQDLAKAELPEAAPRLVMVDFPGKPQSVLIVGQPSVPRSSPDHLALELLNAILGGSFTSRLNQNLRELHGYTYGAGSAFQFGRGPGAFYARSSVKTDVTGAALGEVIKEIDRAVAEPITQPELERGKALLTYELTEQLSHADSAAGAIAAIFIYDLPNDEYAGFVQRLSGLTVGDVQAAAQRALRPGSMTVTIAGDLKAVTPQLEAAKLGLPPAQLRDAAGAEVK